MITQLIKPNIITQKSKPLSVADLAIGDVAEIIGFGDDIKAARLVKRFSDVTGVAPAENSAPKTIRIVSKVGGTVVLRVSEAAQFGINHKVASDLYCKKVGHMEPSSLTSYLKKFFNSFISGIKNIVKQGKN